MKKIILLSAAALSVLLVLVCMACGSDDSSNDSTDGDNDSTDGDSENDGDGDQETVNEEIWCDPSSSLCWQNPQPALSMSQADALEYCDNLIWASNTLWRLPAISELRTLVEGCPASSLPGACGIVDNCRSEGDACYSAEDCGGCGAGSACYRSEELLGECNALWSKTLTEESDLRAWGLDFENAAVEAAGTSELLAVRCVRNLPSEDGDEDADGDFEFEEPADGDEDNGGGDIDMEYAGDYDSSEGIEGGECSAYDSRCANDIQYECVDGKWEFNFDCYESWMTCLDGKNCESYPDCESDTGLACWGERALHCVQAGMDWQLHDDCADWDFMSCADGYCAHNSGPTLIDFANSLEWQWLIYPNDFSEQFGTWAEAGEFCSNLTLAGESDWRLPSISELRWLTGGCAGSENCGVTDTCTGGECFTDGCYGCADHEGPIGDMYYRDDAELLYEADHISYTGEYWSSTTSTGHPDYPTEYAFYVDFDSALVYDNLKTMPYRFRCVRDLTESE